MYQINVTNLHDDLLGCIPNKLHLHQLNMQAWDGEVHITVRTSVGAYGFWSAVILVEHCDSPLEAHTYSGYGDAISRDMSDLQRFMHMYHWIVDTLLGKVLDASGGPNREKGDLSLHWIEHFSMHTNQMVRTSF
jgi:hypothetical protein